MTVGSARDRPRASIARRRVVASAVAGDHIGEREGLTIPGGALAARNVRRVGAIDHACGLASCEEGSCEAANVGDVELAETQLLKRVALVVMDHRDTGLGSTRQRIDLVELGLHHLAEHAQPDAHAELRRITGFSSDPITRSRHLG